MVIENNAGFVFVEVCVWIMDRKDFLPPVEAGGSVVCGISFVSLNEINNRYSTYGFPFFPPAQMHPVGISV